MVARFCCLGYKSPKRILPSTQDHLKSDNNHQDDHTLTDSIINFKKKKIQPNLHHHHQQHKTKHYPGQGLSGPLRLTPFEETKHQQPPLKNHHQLATLEEWILASPGPNDFKLSMQSSSSSRRVYPSSVLQNAASDLSLSVKMKKRVSFRSPEVADVFILDQPSTHH